MTMRGRLACCMPLVAALATGCAPLGVPQQPAAPQFATVAPVSPADREFMSRVAANWMYEIEVSRLAASRAASARVRSYAQMVADQHVQANRELGGLMRARGVPPPAALPADKATKLQRLSSLQPSADFDAGYMHVVGIEDHQAAIAMFERAQREARDRDLRNWIERTLPALRNQLAEARKLTAASSS
jgi:putative membrane protein